MLTAQSSLKLMRFSGAFAAHPAAWNVPKIGTKPATTSQIGNQNYAPSAEGFFAVFMQEIGPLSAKSEIVDSGQKGRILRGQD